MTFEDIKAELARGRNGRKKIGNNTYLHETPGGAVAMQYHETDIAVYRDDYMRLQTGGWYTITTKERLNWALSHAGIAGRVYQVNKIWRVNTGKGEQLYPPQGQNDTEFFDGLRIDYTGRFLNPRPETPKIKLAAVSADYLDTNNPQLAEDLKARNPKAKAITRLLIERYIRALSSAIQTGSMRMDIGGGDCWFCAMTTTDTHQTLGDATGDIDHLVSHLKEKYLMVRLCLNALAARGYRAPGIFILTKENDTIKPDLTTMQEHKETILRAVRAYFETKLLTQLVSA